MTANPSSIHAGTPANSVLSAILSDQTRYPCLVSMLYHLAESLHGNADDLAGRCWEQVNDIVDGKSTAEDVRDFAWGHGKGYSDEAHAFHKSLLYLIDQDETYRTVYVEMSPRQRRDFIAKRLNAAREMTIDYGIAL